jgi:hypothetical protein
VSVRHGRRSLASVGVSPPIFFLSFFPSVPFVMPGHSRLWNGVVSLAYAGQSMRKFRLRSAFHRALVGVTSAWTTGSKSGGDE